LQTAQIAMAACSFLWKGEHLGSVHDKRQRHT